MLTINNTKKYYVLNEKSNFTPVLIGSMWNQFGLIGDIINWCEQRTKLYSVIEQLQVY